VEVLLESPQVKTCRVGTLVISRYFGGSNVDAMDREYAFQVETAERFGTVTSLALIDADQMNAPSGAVKVRAAELTRALGPRLVRGAFVVRGSGFGAAVMMNVLNAFNLISGSGSRQRMFVDLDDALAWLKAAPGQPAALLAVSAADVRAAFSL
jgi:hypothetical protein